MELSYAITNTDGGISAFVVTFLSIIFLACLAFTIFSPRMIMKPPPKLAEPSDKLIISWGERRWLGVRSVTEPNLAARVLAFRARLRLIRPILTTIASIIGVIITIFSAIVLILVLSSFFQQSWLARVIALNFSLIGPYIFLPLFILLSVPCLAWLFLVVRLQVTKNIVPIRLKNETEKILKVYIRGTLIKEVQPGKEIENKKVLSMYNSYLIEAGDDSGNIFYSKEFNLDELDALDWKVTIEGESHNP